LVSSDSEILSLLTSLASSGEYDLILSNSWSYVKAVGEVANQYPNQNFAQMDTRPDIKSGDPGDAAVLGLVFSQEKVSALAGALAAFVAAYHDFEHVGLVLGVEGSILHDFEIGYKWGVDWGLKWLQENKPELLRGKKIASVPRTERVLWTYTGTWGDPAKGKAATLIQIDQGAGIVYQVAGGTGLGVLSGVADYHKEKGITFTKPPFAIGVDADQDWINPYILASAMKRVDHAALEACRLVYTGEFRDTIKKNKGFLSMNLKNNGVGLSDEAILGDFLDFGREAGAIQQDKVPEIVSNYKKLREAHPDWIWETVKELEGLIKDGQVEVPSPFTDPQKYDIKALRKIYG
jgi:basic membrane protein A